MKLSVTFLLLCIFCGIQISTSQINTKGSFEIYSSYLNENRTCLVHLPEFYDIPENKSKKYPVIILLDGSSFFQTTAEIIDNKNTSENRKFKIPESILIAIENIDRRRDFTVTRIETKRGNTSGGGRPFLNFIKNELLPYIKANFKTQNYNILIGHSLGGLLALNSFMDSDTPFNAFISIDPSIWWDEKLMFEKTNNIPTSSFEKKLYIATANQGESNYERNKKRHDRLFDLLVQKSQQPELLNIHYFENENHRSVPFHAIYDGLKFVYSK